MKSGPYLELYPLNDAATIRLLFSAVFVAGLFLTLWAICQKSLATFNPPPTVLYFHIALRENQNHTLY